MLPIPNEEHQSPLPRTIFVCVSLSAFKTLFLKEKEKHYAFQSVITIRARATDAHKSKGYSGGSKALEKNKLLSPGLCSTYRRSLTF